MTIEYEKFGVFNLEEKYREAQALRRFAFLGIFISTIATLLAVVCIPMLYNYMIVVHVRMEDEIGFCQSQTRLLDGELHGSSANEIYERIERDTKADVKLEPHRLKQAIYAGTPLFSSKSRTQRSTDTEGIRLRRGQLKKGKDFCCACGIGPAGEAGYPGTDGHPGEDGEPGYDGQPGIDGFTEKEEHDWCFDCQDGLPGVPGVIGQKGAPGKPGPRGLDGEPAFFNPTGNPGSAGFKGLPGPPGISGAHGKIGKIIEIPGPIGPKGRPGPQGPRGEAGLAGQDGAQGLTGIEGLRGDSGKPGKNGIPGIPGDNGIDGTNGQNGGCGHCVPRKAK